MLTALYLHLQRAKHWKMLLNSFQAPRVYAFQRVYVGKIL